MPRKSRARTEPALRRGNGCPFPRCGGAGEPAVYRDQQYWLCTALKCHSWSRCQHGKLWLNAYWNWFRDPCPCPDDPTAQQTVAPLD